MSFTEQLQIGKTSESRIAKWLIDRGVAVLPVYEIAGQEFKGPQLFWKDNERVAPDMYCFAKDRTFWIEAKHKSTFTWHRITSSWTTGIDLHHWRQYLDIRNRIDVPLYLLFLHVSSEPSPIDAKHDRCPKTCPVGLFGQEILKLQTTFNHTHENHGRHGMIYWRHESLTMFDEVEKVLV